jgi:hypothetical protein
MIVSGQSRIMSALFPAAVKKKQQQHHTVLRPRNY